MKFKVAYLVATLAIAVAASPLSASGDIRVSEFAEDKVAWDKLKQIHQANLHIASDGVVLRYKSWKDTSWTAGYTNEIVTIMVTEKAGTYVEQHIENIGLGSCAHLPAECRMWANIRRIFVSSHEKAQKWRKNIALTERAYREMRDRDVVPALPEELQKLKEDRAKCEAFFPRDLEYCEERYPELE